MVTRTRADRLPPEIFDLPVEKMREGYYTDAYFDRHAHRAPRRRPPPARGDAGLPEHGSVLGGMDEAIAILKLCAEDWDALTVHALYDGDRLEPWRR